jgi:hypothetical protein
LKRALDVIDANAEPLPAAPRVLKLVTQIVSVCDTGDGHAARVFADALMGAGATELEAARDGDADTRVVIRSRPRSAEGRLRAEVLEEGADLVLGSPRFAFARRWAQRGASLRQR